MERDEVERFVTRLTLLAAGRLTEAVATATARGSVVRVCLGCGGCMMRAAAV